MIDFAICAVLLAASVILVRRVRQYGFAGLRPPEALFASVGRVVVPEEERGAELQGNPPLLDPPLPEGRGYEVPSPSATLARPEPGPAPGEPLEREIVAPSAWVPER